MFRKLISDASFSPSSIGTLGPYATRLKHEERSRLAGLLLMIIAVAIQAMVIFLPTDPTNTADANDLLYGGVASREALLTHFDNNEQHLQDIYTSLGINRNDIGTLHPGTIYFSGESYVTGRQQQVGFDRGSITHPYRQTAGGHSAVYLTPISQTNPGVPINSYTSYSALIGHSERVGKFAVITTSGNLVVQRPPASTPTECALGSRDSSCQPCPSTPSILIGNADCELPVLYTKSATNNSQNTIADTTTAKSSDRITYTIRAKNISDKPVEVPFQDTLRDVLEYADVIDTNEGTFDAGLQSISWSPVALEPGESISRSFVVRIKPHIPATAQNLSNPASFDCSLTNFYANTVTIPVACPPQKTIETTAANLPFIPPVTNLLLSGSALAVVLFLYVRTRTQREEIRLIRKNINTGIIE